MIYRAKFVVPISSPPIEDGWVATEDDRITSVSSSYEQCPAEDVVDLGDCAILPAFVNVHTHLGYAILRGVVTEKEFVRWISSIAGFARRFSGDDFRNSAALGALELLRGGVVSVADVAYCGEEIAAASEVGLRGIGCVEIFGDGDSADFRCELAEKVHA